MAPYKVGTVQPLDIQDDIDSAIVAMSGFLVQADRQGISFLCFPECFLQGYTLDEQKTKARAFSLESEQFKDILTRLKSYKAIIILGLIEEDGGSFFNTAVVIKQGKLIGKYRKVNLLEDNFRPGKEHSIFTVSGLTFGINICYDARFSEGAAEMAGKGASVIFYPLSNRWPIKNSKKYRYKHVSNLIDRAMESGCWVISSDITYRDDKTIGFGCSAIVSPEGDVAARVPELEIGITSHELEIAPKEKARI